MTHNSEFHDFDHQVRFLRERILDSDAETRIFNASFEEAVETYTLESYSLPALEYINISLWIIRQNGIYVL